MIITYDVAADYQTWQKFQLVLQEIMTSIPRFEDWRWYHMKYLIKEVSPEDKLDDQFWDEEDDEEDDEGFVDDEDEAEDDDE